MTANEGHPGLTCDEAQELIDVYRKPFFTEPDYFTGCHGCSALLDKLMGKDTEIESLRAELADLKWKHESPGVDKWGEA